ncbi:hypothetical protein BJ978_002441 [Agromyces terreus]|uniref:Uncharacterized protein n=1 Tax=Agromyces terreus TaxID=424795 RepID=A0A9X2H308_9MICO|nr:hypothetical protein [Agromyces terreus]MCP2371765.1 hypothetical protein [Agromyces terreus]
MTGQRADAAAPTPTDAAASPFTMVTGDPSAMVCEGDVCFVPAAE